MYNRVSTCNLANTLEFKPQTISSAAGSTAPICVQSGKKKKKKKKNEAGTE